MGRPIHFEIQADDLERAKKFYGDVFGWQFEDYGEMTGSPYFGVITGEDSEPGINGGLLQRPVPAPAPEQGTNAWVMTMGVDDFDETAAKILAAGVSYDRKFHQYYDPEAAFHPGGEPADSDLPRR